MIEKSLLEDLWSGEKAIAFFVHSGECYWLIDQKYNFALDSEKDYRAYLEKGHITRNQYESACREFRGGVLRLTAGTFGRYLTMTGETLVSRDMLSELFEKSATIGVADLIKKVVRCYLTGESMSDEVFRAAKSFVSVLPSFYINFDRSIYMHMDVDRCHEELAYSDWYAKAGDFLFLIPEAQRYWAMHGDAWKLRFV